MCVCVAGGGVGHGNDREGRDFGVFSRLCRLEVVHFIIIIRVLLTYGIMSVSGIKHSDSTFIYLTK